ncbi:4-hydroxy-tetrahydrodipicolinate synthase [Hazenella sp. IB182357]|uniref:4-hydroxy-tetrahydrodipicolinate synthase n=1 Tax=Polycladospora coralii TaxID=2771432 RepID=A0A926NHL9_9BACL|nr:4-hydroxy-tetrahydrodipicolinate synthase [Polycladospora coralii]MBD1373488.1 4-hydroxy-tetrahydrodipicolinate synthase [Polycladospora coralii]
MQFGRLATALYTPFTKSLDIDWNSLERTIEHLIQTGTDTIVVSGTTAESPTLSLEEKLKLFQFVVKQAQDRVQVIAGTGSNDTAQTIEVTKLAAETGVDGIMLVTPYYNKPSQAALYQHFKSIATHTTLPIMIYNVPGRTAVNMTATTMVQIAQIENVVAIKEASGDIEQITQLIKELPSSVVVYSGDDAVTLPILSLGGVGVVSVASHLVGSEIKEMIDAFITGDVNKAKTINQKLFPVFTGLFMTSSPVPLKYAMSEQGFCEPYVRPPLVEMSESEKKSATEWLGTLV